MYTPLQAEAAEKIIEDYMRLMQRIAECTSVEEHAITKLEEAVDALGASMGLFAQFHVYSKTHDIPRH